MSSKKDIIDRCRASIKERIERPSLADLDPTVYPDPFVEFTKQAEAAGCRIVTAGSAAEIDSVIKSVYPDAKVVASSLPEVKCATVNPDTIAEATELNGTDVGVINARLGVAENGSVWVPQSMKERDVCFISENLVAVLHKKDIVNNMHEAYRRISLPEYGGDNFDKYGYGVFIAGPSKTADIAQVLVKGAQAARSMTLVIIP